MELVWLIPVAGFAAVLYALWLAWDVLRRDSGTPEMQDVASMIFEGAMAFLRRQYSTIAMLALVTAVILVLIVGGVSEGVKEILGEKIGGQVEVKYSKDAVVGRWEEGLLTGMSDLIYLLSALILGLVFLYHAVQ